MVEIIPGGRDPQSGPDVGEHEEGSENGEFPDRQGRKVHTRDG
jgi:hypothetical protein